MSDTDRQVYFSDHVIELQNTEDEKRRRIRDARRRAEKAQVSVFFRPGGLFRLFLEAESGAQAVSPPLFLPRIVDIRDIRGRRKLHDDTKN